MLGLTLGLYFCINIAIALILWFAVLKGAGLSTMGYFLTMTLLGVVIIGILLVLFIIALLMGASYNFGGYMERKLKEVF